MARGYGFKVYVQPILPAYKDLSTIAVAQEARTALGVGGWMDPTTVVASSSVIIESGLPSGSTYQLSCGPIKAITNAALASNVATLTFASSPGFLVGQKVRVEGLIAPFTALNGTFTITVASGSTISYACTTANVTSAAVAVGPTAAAGPLLALNGTDPPFRLLGLKSGPFNSATDKEETPTWDDEAAGYKLSEATAKDGSLSFSGKTIYEDVGYAALRLFEQASVSRNLELKIVRIGPYGYNETIFGYGRFDTFKEGNDAGKVIDWSSDFNFNGPVGLVRHR